MFNLEEKITDWRKQMLATGIQAPVPLEELENHLREEIERQITIGLNGQKAFEAAIQKIGKGNLLNNEFEKVRGVEEIRDWKTEQFLFVGSLSVISLFIAGLLVFKIGSLKEITSAQQMSGLLALAVMVLLAIGGRLSCGFFPVFRSKRTREAVCISVGVLAVSFEVIFFNVVLPRVDYTVSQLAVAVLWAMMTPVGILGGLIAGIETAAWKNSSASQN